MGQNISDSNYLCSVINLRDQAILVATNIEDRAIAIKVSVRITLLNLCQILPLHFGGNSIPGIDGRFAVGMLADKLFEFTTCVVSFLQLTAALIQPSTSKKDIVFFIFYIIGLINKLQNQHIIVKAYFRCMPYNYIRMVMF